VENILVAVSLLSYVLLDVLLVVVVVVLVVAGHTTDSGRVLFGGNENVCELLQFIMQTRELVRIARSYWGDTIEVILWFHSCCVGTQLLLLFLLFIHSACGGEAALIICCFASAFAIVSSVLYSTLY
jgi:hypothetical protein